jgi:hypothetical protein
MSIESEGHAVIMYAEIIQTINHSFIHSVSQSMVDEGKQPVKLFQEITNINHVGSLRWISIESKGHTVTMHAFNQSINQSFSQSMVKQPVEMLQEIYKHT